MATNLPKLIVFTILLMFLAIIAARETRAAAAVETQGGKFAGMVMIPGGGFTMGRDSGPKAANPRDRLA